MEMPVVQLEKLTGEALAYARRITRNGRIRATKPEVKDLESARVAYVWRHVVFYVSPKREHQCMPVLADLELMGYAEDALGSWEAAQAEARRLHQIAEQIVDAVPVSQWHGVLRWGRAFGLLPA